MESLKAYAEAIKQKFPTDVISIEEINGQTILNLKREHALDILKELRPDFEYLADLTAVDYLNQGMPERFAIVYNLYSFTHRVRLRVKAWVPESDPSIASAASLWRSANWAERESFDMMGIKYVGHPDLRRILLPYDYPANPHRKEYPVTGRGERFQFPKDFSR